MEENTERNKYYDAEGEVYAAYLHEQLSSKRWSWSRQRLLLTAEPESLAEAAALIEVIYEYSLTHRMDVEKAVLRISDILDDGRRRTGGSEAMMDMANAYYIAHAAYWRYKVRHSFFFRWLRGLLLGAVLLVLDAVVIRTRLLSRAYVFSPMAMVSLALFMGVFPLVFAWLSAPKVSADERIYTWRMQ